MANPIAYGGRGSLLLYSLDGNTYVPLAQLRQFESGGSKQTLVDQTNLRSPDLYTYPKPVLVDSGEIDFGGALNPEDSSYLALGEFHGGMLLIYWLVVFPDGSSTSFQAYVSEFKPFAVNWNKLIDWSGKLRIVGGFSGISGVNLIFAATTVASTATPVFLMQGNIQLFKMTLTGNVSASMLALIGMVVPALIIFKITQDATGGHTFSWPANVFGGAVPNPVANLTTSQLFYCDGGNAIALTPGTVTP
jgi:hypothetical protein